MQIRIDGNRSTSESWLESYSVPLEELPEINKEEQAVAERLSISLTDFRRSKYASEVTTKQLQVRSFIVGQVVEKWLRAHRFKAETKAVWLKTFDGKFRIDVEIDGVVRSFHLAEDLMDDLLESGSKEAQRSFDLVLAANFGMREVAQAS